MNRNERKQLFNGRCAYCDRKPSETETLTLDHFIPRSQGGKRREGNLIPACQRCNNKKSNSRPFAWYFKQAFFSYERWEEILRCVGQSERSQALANERPPTL